MTLLQLRNLEAKDEQAFALALEQWGAERRKFCFDFEPGMTYAQYCRHLQDTAQGLNLKPGWVPASMLFGFVGPDLVGRVSIRHQLTPYLECRGGHIGWAVAPCHRGKGHAMAMALQALPVCRALGLAELIITCDSSNTASCRIIEKLGSQRLEESIDEHGTPFLRYKLALLDKKT